MELNSTNPSPATRQHALCGLGVTKRNVAMFTLALQYTTSSHLTPSRNTMYWVNTNDMRDFKSLFHECLTAHSSQTHDIGKRTSKTL